ncbi:hypothetical protein HETIRDRAFT_103916 [Heterobasidion irregulare TC 32-1]|uniref:Serine/threonine-protein phosphatase 4 regulatory subunit 3-like central domain-containing protein n=1 Tax=Heterobasidion irregulare (strain TC 32-1) TaxID=747525 RepID=W4JYH8_HETIT|nr:uncharacterized protein HETIRDRAFT_103916 [Heterobasidion irregulare TC 32-1]ETW78504.1 hypothetical protein HETIRDRAFT_103916 [Heterobasidion irregulare TC 32-1]
MSRDQARRSRVARVTSRPAFGTSDHQESSIDVSSENLKEKCVSIPLSQHLHARAAPRYVTHCGRSNVNKDEGVQPAAEDDDEHKQWQRQRMGIDDKDIHNRSRYVVSRVSPSLHSSLILIFSPAPPSTCVPSPPRPFTLPPLTSHTPPMLRTTSTINPALEPTRTHPLRLPRTVQRYRPPHQHPRARHHHDQACPPASLSTRSSVLLLNPLDRFARSPVLPLSPLAVTCQTTSNLSGELPRLLRTSASSHQLIALHNASAQKVYHSYRVQFLKDVVLARILDNPTSNMLNSCIILNQIDIINHLRNDVRFPGEIIDLFVNADGSTRADDHNNRLGTLSVVKEKGSMNVDARTPSPGLPPAPARGVPVAAAALLVDRGVVHAMGEPEGRRMIAVGGEVLTTLLDHNVNGMPERVLL